MLQPYPDPGTPVAPMGDQAEYVRVHRAARKIMGTTCAKCPSIERLHAALRPDVPSERLRTDPRSRCLYSTDPADYEALCATCHYRQDFGGRTHCRNGHEYTPENTGRGKGGSRRCRTCMREQNRRSLAAVQADPQRHAAELARVRAYKAAQR